MSRALPLVAAVLALGGPDISRLVPTGRAPRRHQSLALVDDSARREMAEHNAEVERRRAAKLARRACRRQEASR